jgi:nicotinamide mononucleotide transporter
MLETAFSILGAPVTWLEVAAFLLALGCIVCNVYEIHWGWPLAIVSSLLYAWLFFANRLYGDVAVQGFFVVSSAWGWWEWRFARRAGGPAAAPGPLRVSRLGRRRRFALAGAWLLAWPLLGALLQRYTDTDVAYYNAFPTAGSFLGQILMALKFVECWPVWLVVNVTGMTLYAFKDLWLTSMLYAVFAALAVAGWRRWRMALAPAGPAS